MLDKVCPLSQIRLVACYWLTRQIGGDLLPVTNERTYVHDHDSVSLGLDYILTTRRRARSDDDGDSAAAMYAVML